MIITRIKWYTGYEHTYKPNCPLLLFIFLRPDCNRKEGTKGRQKTNNTGGELTGRDSEFWAWILNFHQDISCSLFWRQWRSTGVSILAQFLVFLVEAFCKHFLQENCSLESRWPVQFTIQSERSPSVIHINTWLFCYPYKYYTFYFRKYL